MTFKSLFLQVEPKGEEKLSAGCKITGKHKETSAIIFTIFYNTFQGKVTANDFCSSDKLTDLKNF